MASTATVGVAFGLAVVVEAAACVRLNGDARNSSNASRLPRKAWQEVGLLLTSRSNICMTG